MKPTMPLFRSLACLAATLGAVLAGMLALAPRVGAQETELGPVFLLSLGGKLYDDAWMILDQYPPDGRNPALEDASSVTTRNTWRCVTCHGWDYTGVEIEGRSFPGLDHLRGGDPDAIKQSILDPDHPFPGTELPELSADLLALFISEGLYERGELIDETGTARGNPEFGRDIYEGGCISCHQLDGRRFLRGERGDRSSLGWVARNRPEQALHKIVNGVPAAEMLSLRFLSEAMISDVMAYLQTLDPAEQ